MDSESPSLRASNQKKFPGPCWHVMGHLSPDDARAPWVSCTPDDRWALPYDIGRQTL